MRPQMRGTGTREQARKTKQSEKQSELWRRELKGMSGGRG